MKGFHGEINTEMYQFITKYNVLKLVCDRYVEWIREINMLSMNVNDKEVEKLRDNYEIDENV